LLLLSWCGHGTTKSGIVSEHYLSLDGIRSMEL
jgi:hypothetical protein